MKVPFVRQLGLRDCGAACLAMVLSYHGRATSLSQIREVMRVGRDGVTAASIVTAARAEGLQASGKRLLPEVDLAAMSFPFIAHWQQDHFIVVEKADDTFVQVLDPAIGRKRLTLAAFWQGFSGVALEFAPTPQLTPRTASRTWLWRQYWGIICATPSFFRRLRDVFIMSTLLQLILLATPLVTWLIIDKVLGEQQPDMLLVAGLAAAMIVILTTGATIFQTFALLRVRRALDQHLEEDFTSHTLRQDLEFFDAHGTGDLMNRFSAVSAVRQVITDNLLVSLTELGFFIVYVVLLGVMAPVFLLVVLGVGLVDGLVLLAFWRKLHQLRQVEIETEAQEKTLLLQMVRGVASLKAIGAEPYLLNRWKSLFRKALEASINAERMAQLLAAVGPVVTQIANFALLIFGAQMVLGGGQSLGEMLALVAVGTLAITPFQTFVSSAQQILQAQAQVERLLEVWASEPEQQDRTLSGEPGQKITFSGRIELENISLRYSPDSDYALKGVSITIEAGDSVAIVGASGSGKSSLLRLILGLTAPTEGRVLYDGQDAADLDVRHLRSRISVVMQQPFLVSGSLRENILLGHPLATDIEAREDIIEVATRRAGLLGEVLAMPMGFSTIIGENGSGLSGGQIQRLSLAQAFARDPALLVLDEATNSLDTETEAGIVREIEQSHCTVITVAHRLSTVRNARRILVLENGEIIESGDHAGLIAKGGLYAKLVSSQTLE
ncbi:MAG TPA: peptidase domain-containing ABC transporter [Rhodobacteraceae bacterium]|nr:peptidase domain-containing ABC transporter [Paracoccaceae bacterium]